MAIRCAQILAQILTKSFDDGTTSYGHNSARHELSRAILNYTIQWLLFFHSHDKISTFQRQDSHKTLQKVKTNAEPFFRTFFLNIDDGPQGKCVLAHLKTQQHADHQPVHTAHRD